MSLKWTSGTSDNSILRKKDRGERKEELLIFGYSCKLFREDEKALFIDQGKHLIPWMGDESLKIDRYDVRGTLHDLLSVEAPPGGHDWHLELTDAEKRVEQLCDEERYRALHTDEDEEEMYKEEELKRLKVMGGKYGQVGFTYDLGAKTDETKEIEAKAEDEEPFIASAELVALLTEDTVLPQTLKQNAIIEKTATFILKQGIQMEIFLKAKQSGNVQFDFLMPSCNLNNYYRQLVELLRDGKYRLDKDVDSEKNDDQREHYLHPSLSAPVVELAPSIPSIHYKPSADCDYTMLITKLTGKNHTEEESQFEEPKVEGDIAPPGTEPLELPNTFPTNNTAKVVGNSAEIAKGPVLYSAEVTQPAIEPEAPTSLMPTAFSSAVSSPRAATDSGQNSPAPSKSLGLNLMHYYNSESGSGSDDSDSSSSSSDEDEVLIPPEDVQTVISKMATYVARNGDNFEDVVKARNDPRFTFLERTHEYHPYYLKLKNDIRSVDAKEKRTKERKEKRDKRKETAQKRHSISEKEKTRSIAPVSFQIKPKPKEPEPQLPKPALPYESSTDEEGENKKSEEATTVPSIPVPGPQAVIYKMDAMPTPPPVERPIVLNDVKKRSETPTPDVVPPVIKQSSTTVNNPRSEVVSIDLDESDDELIDLTEDTREDMLEDRKRRRAERKARATAFLSKIAGATVPTSNNSSLASVLVKTLTKLEIKKQEEEIRALKKKKRKHYHRENELEDERRKEKSHRKSKKRKDKERTPEIAELKEEKTESHSSKSKHRHKKEKKHKSSVSSKSKRNKSVTEEEPTKEKKRKRAHKDDADKISSNGQSKSEKIVAKKMKPTREKSISEGECTPDQDDDSS